MSKYTKTQMKSFFEDATRYVEEHFDKKLVLNVSAGPALAISFKSVDNFTGFIITVVNNKVVEGIEIRVNTEDCIDYARKDPAFIDGMPDGTLADSVAFSGLALALLDLGVTPVEYPAVRNAVLDQVLPLVSPTEPDEENGTESSLPSELLELLTLLEILQDLKEDK